MIHFSALDIAAIFALLAWPAIAIIVAALGIAGWLRPQWRQRASWRRATITAVALLVVDTLPASPMIGEIARELVRGWKAEYFTYRLDAPRILDGTAFPAGCVVGLSTDPPHRLEGGTVPVPTKVLGLEVVGAFSIGLGNDGRPLCRDGTLASDAAINTIPCAPGPFTRDEHEVQCPLAGNLPIAGMVLRAGTSADIWFDPLGRSPDIKVGTLAESARLSGLSCGAGAVEYAAYRVRCILAEGQVVRGFPLAGGRGAALSSDSDGAQSVDEGTLSAPLPVLGVTLPAGARIKFVGHYTAAELRAGPLADNQDVSFMLPEDAELLVEGATLKGEIEVEFSRGGLEVAIWELGDKGGEIIFGGQRHHLGFFDGERHRWRFDNEIGRPD